MGDLDGDGILDAVIAVSGDFSLPGFPFPGVTQYGSMIKVSFNLSQSEQSLGNNYPTVKLGDLDEDGGSRCIRGKLYNKPRGLTNTGGQFQKNELFGLFCWEDVALEMWTKTEIWMHL